jgi:hypothetical protein
MGEVENLGYRLRVHQMFRVHHWSHGMQVTPVDSNVEFG